MTPRADPKQTIIVGSIVIFGTAILVLAAIMLYSSLKKHFSKNGLGKKEVVRKKAVKPKHSLTLEEKLRFWSVAIAVLIIIIVGAYMVGERPAVCTNCHLEKIPYKTWRKSKHSSIGCMGCHRSTGLSGYAEQKIDYLRWIWRFEIGDRQKITNASIDNGVCLKCHRKETRKTIISKGIRVRHKDFLDEGALCADCHNTTGHTVNNPKHTTMDQCVVCHNAVKVSAKCEMCHTEETPGSSLKKREVAPFDIPPPKNCRFCHTKKAWSRCIKCHSLEMPHPAGWSKGSHAKLAFLNKEKICFKCHTFPPSNLKLAPHGGNGGDGYFCNNCHSFPSPHGPSKVWAKAHGSILGLTKTNIIDPVVGQVCGECHTPFRIKNCKDCHGEGFCDRCHDGKYQMPPYND